ncbi:MAG: STAS domain-containing protein [Phycisphaerae bacterium]|nr:STAS domain-containing protein [Phycisphaerae bacterium]
MKIASYQHGRATVVAPREAIVENDCADVQRSVLEAIANGASQIVVDLGEVPFIDSAGLELLCELQKTCADSGAHMKITSVDEMCREILRITDLAHQFQTFESVEEAVRSST